jgi:uncharacterized protein (TIGR03435 family)
MAAAIHMLVEAIFWFHPLVWWLGARLVEERERVCDEAVLALGSERRTYAESILKTCEFCLESPLVCVAGVTGADLKERIIRVMTPRLANKLSFGRKLLLAAIGTAAVAGPVVFGLLNAPPIEAQSAVTASEPLPSFEVASIKLCRERENSHLSILPNRLTVRNQPVEFLIKIAYGQDLGKFGFRMLRDNRLVGGPDWMYGHLSGYDGYDVDAKVEDALAAKFAKLPCGSFLFGPCAYREQMILMLQSLLAERFKLKVRRDMTEGAVFALVVAKGGPKFLQAKFETSDDPAHMADPTLPRPTAPPCPTGMRCWHNYGSMGLVVDILSRMSEIGRPVLDQTGLEGGYYLDLQYSPQPLTATAATDDAAPSGPSGPSIFTALERQLGLKLKPAKGPVESIVIEHIERPSEN